MFLITIRNRFERVINHSFGCHLLARGYERRESQFYLRQGSLGKLVTIDLDTNHTYHQITVFTIRVQILSDDVWQVMYPDRVQPVFPFEGSPYAVFDRNLGQFYGKKRGTQWLALDGTMPEHIMTRYLSELLMSRILPYLDRFVSVDDIIEECSRVGFSRLRMLLLVHLDRRDEARLELKKLLASRHQKGFRIGIVELGQKLGIL